MKKVIILISFLGLFFSCTKKFEEMNIDPNNPVDASSQSILLKAQIDITHVLLDDNNIFSILNWVQYNGLTGYSEQPYDYNWNTDATYNGETSVLANLELLRKQAIKDKHLNYEAAAMIMEAWVFSNFTDMNGDIPYSEALKGSEGVLYPKYDSQEDIYNDLVLKLKEANDKINVSADNGIIDAGSDIFCQGNMLKWKKFGNSLRARLYMRMSAADNAQAKAGLEEIFKNPDVNPIIDDNDYNVGVAYIEKTTGSNTNVFVSETRSGAVRAVSSTIVDLLCANDDPRRKIFLNPTKTSVDSVMAGVWDKYVYRGVPPVINNPFTSFALNDVSTVGDAISLDYERPVDVITYAEVMFIAAEAASKGYDVGQSTNTFYEKGIKGSMEKWGVTNTTQVTDYINGSFASLDGVKDNEKILTQRYIEQFHQALNTFAMIRRSGYPNLKWINVGFAKDDGFPDRMPYAFNMRSDPDYQTANSQTTQGLWGKVWFAAQTEVSTSPVYQTPVIYEFPDK